MVCGAFFSTGAKGFVAGTQNPARDGEFEGFLNTSMEPMFN
jgi:hypothetical protein